MNALQIQWEKEFSAVFFCPIWMNQTKFNQAKLYQTKLNESKLNQTFSHWAKAEKSKKYNVLDPFLYIGL